MMTITLNPVERITLLNLMPNETGSLSEQFVAEEISEKLALDKPLQDYDGVTVNESGSVNISQETVKELTIELEIDSEARSLILAAFKLIEKRSKPTEEGGSIDRNIFAIYKKIKKSDENDK